MNKLKSDPRTSEFLKDPSYLETLRKVQQNPKDLGYVDIVHSNISRLKAEYFWKTEKNVLEKTAFERIHIPIHVIHIGPVIHICPVIRILSSKFLGQTVNVLHNFVTGRCCVVGERFQCEGIIACAVSIRHHLRRLDTVFTSKALASNTVTTDPLR